MWLHRTDVTCNFMMSRRLPFRRIICFQQALRKHKYYISICHAEISTKLCTCCDNSCILHWIPHDDKTMHILSFHVHFPSPMNLPVSSEKCIFSDLFSHLDYGILGLPYSLTSHSLAPISDGCTVIGRPVAHVLARWADVQHRTALTPKISQLEERHGKPS